MSERLREAAKVLRERAEAATPVGHRHPWRYTDATYGDPASGPTHAAVVCCDGTGVTPNHFLYAEEGCEETSSIAIYIATMHPGVGLALAAWLDAMARSAIGTSAGDVPYEDHALRIADLILGSAE